MSAGDIPTFKLLKPSGEIITLDGDIDGWMANGIFILSGLHAIEHEVSPIPEKAALTEAHPNPFNPVTTISFGLDKDATVSIQIYNIQGRMIETLTNQYMQAGYHSVIWNADQHSSGVYFVRMIVAGKDVGTRQKLLLVK